MILRVLLDNTSFAGIMRLFVPDVAIHRRFLSQYPAHRELDERAFADFLLCLCLHDRIVLECSSSWNDDYYHREQSASVNVAELAPDSWAAGLKRLLPTAVSKLIDTEFFDHKPVLDEGQSICRAFEIMQSDLAESLRSMKRPKIPDVYYAPDYVYRRFFEGLNATSSKPLGEEDLAVAMFLHRGLYLQSRAHAFRCIYMPYASRGQMLAKLPPMIWVLAEAPPSTLPLARYTGPITEDHFRELNEFYFALLQQVTWTTYDAEVPFIGAALLAAARGSPAKAVEKALQLRADGTLKRTYAQLSTAVRRHDRPRFEKVLDRYRKELTAAARHCGLKGAHEDQRTFYRLVTSWIPEPFSKVVDAAMDKLPDSLQDWAEHLASRLVTKTPVQMLFLDHVVALSEARGPSRG